jgi:hypothetical protein
VKKLGRPPKPNQMSGAPLRPSRSRRSRGRSNDGHRGRGARGSLYCSKIPGHVRRGAWSRDGEVFTQRQEGREERHAPSQEGHAEKRQGWQGRHGEESQAGDRHRALGSPQERQEGAEASNLREEIRQVVVRRPVVALAPIPFEGGSYVPIEF